jgi:hypothetical protein
VVHRHSLTVLCGLVCTQAAGNATACLCCCQHVFSVRYRTSVVLLRLLLHWQLFVTVYAGKCNRNACLQACWLINKAVGVCVPCRGVQSSINSS